MQQMMLGPELLVTLVRDPIVGSSITVGMGGWAAKAELEFFIAPVTEGSPCDFAGPIEGTQLGRLLDAGQKQALAALLDKRSGAFTGVAWFSFDVVECNPVILTASGAVVADVLMLQSQIKP